MEEREVLIFYVRPTGPNKYISGLPLIGASSTELSLRIWDMRQWIRNTSNALNLFQLTVMSVSACLGPVLYPPISAPQDVRFRILSGGEGKRRAESPIQRSEEVAM